jgi:hypothetical protein
MPSARRGGENTLFQCERRSKGINANHLRLIVLLKAEHISAFPETPSADIEAILADHTTWSLANSAAAFKRSFGVLARVLRDKSNRH